MQFSAAKWGRWVMERDASAEQTEIKGMVGGWRGGWGLGHDIISVPCFALTPSESAQPTQRGCVVTPRTWRTLLSQNSTFVMSCRQGCYLGADWPAHFYCPTTQLTFEPQRAIVVDHTGMHKKKKKEMSFSPWHVHMWNQSLYMARTSQNNHCALHVSTEEKCHNGFNQSRPKCRVHSPPEAFLSLIRGASSCLQPKTCLPPWWQACSQTLISNPSHILSLLTASYSIFLHDQIL